MGVLWTFLTDKRLDVRRVFNGMSFDQVIFHDCRHLFKAFQHLRVQRSSSGGKKTLLLSSVATFYQELWTFTHGWVTNLSLTDFQVSLIWRRDRSKLYSRDAPLLTTSNCFSKWSRFIFTTFRRLKQMGRKAVHSFLIFLVAFSDKYKITQMMMKVHWGNEI